MMPSPPNDPLLAEIQSLDWRLRLEGPPPPREGGRRGALSVLFMAAAPRGEMELAFEEEEARILARTADLGLDLFVEDTGTARER